MRTMSKHLFIWILALPLSVGAVESSPRIVRSFLLMGTTLEVTVTGVSDSQAIEISERVRTSVDQTESRLSTWRSNTELAHLNSAPVGASISLSPELKQTLTDAFECAELTGHAFSPTLAPLMKAWDIRGKGRTPTSAEILKATADSELSMFRLSGSQATRLSERASIEEGGFGKGAALDEALRAVQLKSAKVTLNFGGQIAVSDDVSTTIQLAHPTLRVHPVAEVTLTGGSASTSGVSEKPGHILDPSTGRPALFKGSVTVLLPSSSRAAMRADCLSTALFVMGPSKGLQWIRSHPDSAAEVIFLENVGNQVVASTTCKTAQRLRSLDPRFEIQDDCSRVVVTQTVQEKGQ